MTQAQFNLLTAFVSCEPEHVYGSVTVSYPDTHRATMLVNNAPKEDEDDYAPNDYFIPPLQTVGIENIKCVELTTPTKHLLIKC